MAATARTVRLASRLSTISRPIVPRVATSAAQRAAFTVSARRFKSEVIKETEVPVSVYNPDAKGVASGTSDHFSIPVKPNFKPQEPAAAEPEDRVDPLSEKVYKQMPRTLQKMSLLGKVVIITGGARGLGNYMARACVEAGAKAIAIFDANQELGDESAAELHQKSGLPVSFFKVDVRDGNAINAAVQNVVDLYGTPDVLVNSAGIADSNIKAETYDPAMFRRLIDINLTGSFLMAQAVGRTMIAAGKPGSIILVASMSGSIVNYPQEQSCYNASKAGVIQFGKSLAAEWAKYDIRVNCISPGYMDTALNRVPALDAQKKIWKSLTPQERLGAVDDLNGLCVFLASDASSFMTGSNVLIDGGYTLY
ncbi:short-chain dehydrogenase/ reductase [Podospora aff. communis PSN243]|uniref:Short-chain dehydrogenase/ reductase n=1 Tax=Podospora aff. communis PSN243 TaxID=3040156 RepID=A0AAV9GZF4_9PEZI|nr:short-chain dehydrogenase/ reductase [Podospora aff. communis PSN243]